MSSSIVKQDLERDGRDGTPKRHGSVRLVEYYICSEEVRTKEQRHFGGAGRGASTWIGKAIKSQIELCAQPSSHCNGWDSQNPA